MKKNQKVKSPAPSLSWFDFLIIFGLSLLLGIVFNLSNPNGIKLVPKFWSGEAVSTVAPSQAMGNYVGGNTLFVDARPSNFFEQEHIKGAINLPLSLFDIVYMVQLNEIDKEKEIIVYGRTISGFYDEEVARKLILRGHKKIKILSGGMSAWKGDGYPVEP